MNTDTSHSRIQKTTHAVALCVLAALMAGCELDDTPVNSMTIYPTSVFLDVRETNIVEFTATGANNNIYRWSMNNTILGSIYIAATNASVALYLSTTNTGTNIITVRDSTGDSADARIVQWKP
jgi:hypothetical protein